MNATRTLLAALVLLSLLPAALAADATLKSATYCRELAENQSAKDKTESFSQAEKICLSVELKGRPKAGIAAATFYFRNQVIAEAKVDVAEVNKGVFFSIGQNTFVGFSLTPSRPLPVGSAYRTEVTFEGKPLGTFPFVIAPPKDAIPSKINAVTVARGVNDNSAPVGETREFTPAQKVTLAGKADLGDASWLEATWFVAGKADPLGTKSFTLEENKKDVPFYFSFIPKGGWPEGPHEVALVLNGKEVAREKFTVKPGPGIGSAKLEIAKTRFFHDDGKGSPGAAAKSFGVDDRVFHVEFALAELATVRGTKVHWILVEAAGEKEQTIATAEIDEEGPQSMVTSLLTTKKGLPPGKYRVELHQGDKALARQAFSVGETAADDAPVGGGLRGKK